MKPTLVFLLCLSLVANGLLYQRSQQARSDSLPAAKSNAPPTPRSFVLDDALWTKAINGDADSLRTIRDSGLSPELTRTLMAAVIREIFKARMEALNPSANEVKYWDPKYGFGYFMPKSRIAALDLHREQQAMIDKWVPKTSDEDTANGAVSSFTTPEKRRKLEAIEEDYAAMTADVRTAMGQGSIQVTLPEDREKLAFLQKEKAKEIAELLTPQELEEYNVRSSGTASSLRYELSSFEPTEKEFRDIVKLRKDVVDDMYPRGLNALTPEERIARSDAQKLADAEIKKLLGEQRYAEYTRAQDVEYRTISQIAEHFQLPKDRANEAYRVKTDLEQQFRKMNPTTQEERRQALTSLLQVADREFTRILGEKGYAVYKQYGNLPRMAQSILNAQPPPASRPKG